MAIALKPLTRLLLIAAIQSVALAGSFIRCGTSQGAPPQSTETNKNTGPASRAADALGSTVLGIDGSRFTINGKPDFLLGISYYGALGAPRDFIRQDVDDISQAGFNWLRVWATWSSSQADISAIDSHGKPREPFLAALQWLVAECDRRGLMVDVTLTRGKASDQGRLSGCEAHTKAIETVVAALKPHRNWYLDLANERDVRDARYVPAAELKKLRELVRKLDPQRLVTASFGGHDLSESDLRESLLEVGLDFITPHRPREADSPAQTELMTRECLSMMMSIGRVTPLHYQEPFRRGYAGWEPLATDFITDLRGALNGGAAGWCFHNGSTRGGRPYRSFDLHAQRLFEQLDDQELKVVHDAALQVREARHRDGK